MKKNYLLMLMLAVTFSVIAQNYRLLIGTYTNTGKSKGIYSYEINVKEGAFVQKSVAEQLENPSFLTLTPDRKFVYAVSESGEGSKAGAFGFDTSKGAFSFLNVSETNGKGPCYITATKQHVITANYAGGSISVFARNANGTLSNVLQVIKHTGSSIDPKRQKQPYVHQVIFTPDGKYLAVNDLGTDKVTVYRYDSKAANQVLVPHDSISVKAGSGPRHLAFSKNGKRAYLLQEMDGTITVFDVKDGKLQIIQETTVVQKNNIESGAADIHLSPDGKFLYATNRGNANDISCFSVGKDGRLTFVSQVSTAGIGPRNFAITPDGKYLFVGNQRSDVIVIFERDKKSGKLTDTGKRLEVGAPVCLVFY